MAIVEGGISSTKFGADGFESKRLELDEIVGSVLRRYLVVTSFRAGLVVPSFRAGLVVPSFRAGLVMPSF